MSPGTNRYQGRSRDHSTRDARRCEHGWRRRLAGRRPGDDRARGRGLPARSLRASHRVASRAVWTAAVRGLARPRCGATRVCRLSAYGCQAGSDRPAVFTGSVWGSLPPTQPRAASRTPLDFGINDEGMRGLPVSDWKEHPGVAESVARRRPGRVLVRLSAARGAGGCRLAREGLRGAERRDFGYQEASHGRSARRALPVRSRLSYRAIGGFLGRQRVGRQACC